MVNSYHMTWGEYRNVYPGTGFIWLSITYHMLAQELFGFLSVLIASFFVLEALARLLVDGWRCFFFHKRGKGDFRLSGTLDFAVVMGTFAIEIVREFRLTNVGF